MDSSARASDPIMYYICMYDIYETKLILWEKYVE